MERLEYGALGVAVARGCIADELCLLSLLMMQCSTTSPTLLPLKCLRTWCADVWCIDGRASRQLAVDCVQRICSVSRTLPLHMFEILSESMASLLLVRP